MASPPQPSDRQKNPYFESEFNIAQQQRRNSNQSQHLKHSIKNSSYDAHIKKKMQDQHLQEQKYLAEMRPYKSGLSSTKHMFHKINPRSRINLYLQRNSNKPPALQAATPTVDQALIKSRIVTKAWVNQLIKKEDSPKKSTQQKVIHNKKRSQTVSNYNSEVVSLTSEGKVDDFDDQDERRSQNKTEISAASKAESTRRQRTTVRMEESKQKEEIFTETKLAKFRTLRGIDNKKEDSDNKNLEEKIASLESLGIEVGNKQIPYHKQIQQEERPQLTPEQYNKLKQAGLQEYRDDICTLA